MKITFKGGIVDKFNVIDLDSGKKLYDVAKRSVMGTRYSIIAGRSKVASVEKNPYNVKHADIIIGGAKKGIVETDWTNKLTINLDNKWYISKNKDGYDVRSYGKIVGRVNCKYGLAEKYEIEVLSEEDILTLVCVVLALDIINYEVER